MTLRVQIDTTALAKNLTALEKTQMPYAIATAINLVATGKTRGLSMAGSAQQAERDRLAAVFTLRRPDFVQKQGVKVIGGFATKASPSITLGVDPKADFLDKFESDRVKRARKPGGLLAIPVDVKPNRRGIVTTANRAGNLVTRNPSRFFVVRPNSSDPRTRHLTPGIWGRFGRGQRLRLMYAFETEVPIVPVLAYARTIEKAVTEKWTEAFALAFADALRTAR